MAQSDNGSIVAGGLTQKQIDHYKKKHGKLTLISVGNGEEGKHHLWFRKPDMTVIKAASAQIEQSPIDSAQIYWKNCLIHGDKTLVDDVEVFTSVAPRLNGLVNQRTTELKNF